MRLFIWLYIQSGIGTKLIDIMRRAAKTNNTDDLKSTSQLYLQIIIIVIIIKMIYCIIILADF